MEELPRIEVTWVDAWSDTAYIERSAASNLVSVERFNRGLLVLEDDENIIITQGTINNVFQGRLLLDGFQVIHKGMIKERDFK